MLFFPAPPGLFLQTDFFLCIFQELSIVRTVTDSALGGLISSRDFVDLCVTERADDYISTNGKRERERERERERKRETGVYVYVCACVCIYICVCV